MQKVLICGSQENKEAIIKRLHELNIIELAEIQHQEETQKNEEWELAIAELSASILFLEKTAKIKKSFIDSFAPPKKNASKNTLIHAFKTSNWQDVIKKIKTIEGELANIRNLKSKLSADIVNLTP